MKRNRINGSLLQALESYFKHTPKPCSGDILMLSRKHNFSSKSIYNWFWHKRRVIMLGGDTKRKRRYHYVSKSSSELDELDSDYSSPKSTGSCSQGRPANSAHSSVISVAAYDRPLSNVLENSDMTLNCNSLSVSPQNRLQTRNQGSAQSTSVPENSCYPRQNQQILPTGRQNYAQYSPYFSMDDILGGLRSHEISILEKVFTFTPNPTSEDISKLATHFVKVNEKEEQIQEWFARRQCEQDSSWRNNQAELQFEICEDVN